MKALNLIISRFIIFLLGSVVAFNFTYNYFFGSTIEYCDCTDFKDILLISEIVQTIFITFMALVVYRLRLCLSNKLAIAGLYLLNITNIVALTTNIHYDFYSPIYTQIAVSGIFIISILYLLKRKE